MNIAELFQISHQQVRLKDLTRFGKDSYDKWKTDTCSFAEWVEAVRSCGYDEEKFYVDETGPSLQRFYYVGEYGTASYPTLDREWIANEFTLQLVDTDKHYKKLFENGDYTLYFFPEGNPFAIDYFNRHFELIPKDLVFDVFESLYLLLESGFVDFKPRWINEILELAPKENMKRELLEKRREEIEKSGEITIYRGIHSHSTPIEQALSWTISEKVARTFADRFEQGYVVKATVKIDDISHYTNAREEEEVWVKYESLKDICGI